MTYGANRDLLIAGALLHDIGKLHELSYDVTTDYSVEGNLIGHIAIGAGMLRDAVRELPDFPRDLAARARAPDPLAPWRARARLARRSR